MSVAKRIIPCLDVDKGRVVKGVNFVDIIDAGDPVEIARAYDQEGADEITFLDITASHEGRKNIISVVESVANEVFIPLTVGGGVRNFIDVRDLLSAGADKITINTAAVMNPDLINQVTDKIGRQCIVVAVDIKKINDLLKKIGSESELKKENMDKCLKDDKAQDDILNQRIEAQKKYKIESTPTVLINEKKYTGKIDYNQFKKIIEKKL